MKEQHRNGQSGKKASTRRDHSSAAPATGHSDTDTGGLRRQPGRGRSNRQRSTQRSSAIRPAVGPELDVPTPSHPPELPWVANLRLYWLGVTPARRRRALKQLRSAAGRKHVEKCLGDIQESLRLLSINPSHAARIIIMLFQAMGGPKPVGAAKRIAGKIRKTLASF